MRTSPNRRRWSLWVATLLTAFTLALPTVAVAQPRQSDLQQSAASTPGSRKGYAMAYIITAGLIVAGMAAVCRPSFRHREGARVD